MKQRLYPCLCVSCPECGSVFHAVAMWQEFHGDNEGNKELLDTLCEYAEEGYNVSFRNRDEFDLKYCEHMKSSQWKDFFVNKKGSCNLHSQRRKRQFCERFKYIKHKAGILQNCLEVTSLFLLAPPFFFTLKTNNMKIILIILIVAIVGCGVSKKYCYEGKQPFPRGKFRH